MDWRLHLWSSLALICLAGGLGGFFLFDLIALRDPEAMTVSQELREFLTWGWESYVLIFGFTVIIVLWFFAHLLNPNSP